MKFKDVTVCLLNAAEICGTTESAFDIYQVVTFSWFPVGWCDSGILHSFFHGIHFCHHLDSAVKPVNFFNFFSNLVSPSLSCIHVHMFLPQLRFRSNALLTRSGDKLHCGLYILGFLGGRSNSCPCVASTVDLGMVGHATVHYTKRFPRVTFSCVQSLVEHHLGKCLEMDESQVLA